MTLARSSLILVTAGIVGLAVVIVWGMATWWDVRTHQQGLAALIELQDRTNAFSVAADALVLNAPLEDGLLVAFRREARAVRARLAELTPGGPDAVGAKRAIDRMVALLDAEVRGAPTADDEPSMPAGVREVQGRMASHGVALDQGIATLIRERHRALTRRALAGTATFGGAAVVYGLLGVLAFLFMRRRVWPSVRELSRVVDRVAADDTSARADVRGRHELSHLAGAFNHMLERQQATETELRAHQEALERRARMLAESQRMAKVGSWSWSAEGDRVHWSEETFRILGLTPGQVEPSVDAFVSFLDREDAGRLRTAWEAAKRGEDVEEARIRVVRPDGAERHLRLRIGKEADESGLPQRFTGTVQDVTDEYAMVSRLRDQEERLRASRDRLQAALGLQQALIDSLPANIALLDRDGTVLDVNQQWRSFGRENGYRGDDLGVGSNYLASCDRARGDGANDAHTVAKGLRSVLAGERDAFIMEYPCHAPDELRWFRLMVNRVRPEFEDGSLGAHAVVMHVDVTERKLAEQHLARLVYQDRLTGLWSRNGFTREVARHLEQGWRPGACVVVLDLIRLRTVNDAHGYEVGDALLNEVGRRLTEHVGEGGVVARLGGDEYAVFLPEEGAPSDDGARTVLNKVFETPFWVHPVSLGVAARFGRTRLGETFRSVEELLREAEVALFNRREASHEAWSEYSSELDSASQARAQLTRELREALEADQFQLHYQPKVDLDSGRVVAGEALLRWVHPERGLQSPGAFVPVAEQSGLIVPIGLWVLNAACRSLRAWQDAGLDIVRIAVNVSIEQFTTGDFVEALRTALDTHDVDPAGLMVEITESVFERESHALWRQMDETRSLGVRLALDDFGTGFSSLLYLKNYPFDEIKIDGAFVRDLTDDAYSRKLIGTVQNIGAALGAEVVAEGVETAAQRAALLEMGCRVGQGYYFSMPLEEEDFRWLLERGDPLPLTVRT